MSRILFVMLHPGFVRYYDDALQALAAAGHQIHVAFEVSRTKLGEDVTAQRLASMSDRITCGPAPTRAESVRTFLARSDRTATRSGGAARRWRDPEARAEAWESFGTTVRLALDYLRYFEPAFEHATALRARAEKRLPRVYPPMVRGVARMGSAARAALSRLLLQLESLAPPNAAIDAFIREQAPDLLLVTPLIELGSQQVDYIKSARRVGVRTALCVASWDNLTSKGLIRVVPDRVIVWNEQQKSEAVTLHGVAPEQVMVTGAQLFDKWFTATPSRTRESFCRRVGLDSDRPFVLYVGSSMFIAPDEVPFAERWLSSLRRAESSTSARLGVLFRPHPANADQWRALDLASEEGVALWPPIGTDPTAADFRSDFFDSLFYSAAIVGINTSAQIEAAIVGRPVLTIRASEFAHAQQGTLHFRHLVGAQDGCVIEAHTLDEHVGQLLAAVGDPAPSIERDRRFVASFIRPRGVDVPAVPVFVESISALARERPPAVRPESWWLRATRPPAIVLARLAHVLAEDRPLWILALRPVITAAVWIAWIPFRIAGAWHDHGYLRVKRLLRATQRAWYESTQVLRHRAHRARKPILSLVRSAARRLAGKNA
ncbi:MAG TPA: hypothetical protein VKB50_29070 [Vicinamibacterales bacterium]|nr:hypothetical protein [Vicinamibacterales bacterium]